MWINKRKNKSCVYACVRVRVCVRVMSFPTARASDNSFE